MRLDVDHVLRPQEGGNGKPSTTVVVSNDRGQIEDREDSIDFSETHLIQAELLIPGRGDPISNASLVYRSSTITWVGPTDSLPSKYTSLTPQDVKVLMPGLWDVHCHYTGTDVVTAMTGSTNLYLPGMNALIGAVTVKDLEETLMAGYTSVRELEGFAGDVKKAVEMGYLVGPNIYSSHSAMSITGGHGDDHDLPIMTVKEAMNRGGAPLAVCDGVDECVKATRSMIRRGASVIKVCSSGGVLSLNDDPEDRQFSDAELRAIVEEAGRSRRAVAAHAIGKAGIMAALHAGVQSIEHGMYLDEECIALMKEKGAYYVPTQHIIRTIISDYVDDLPPKIQAKVRTVAAHGQKAYKLAVKHGVKFALGTDMLSSDRKSKLSHGNNAHELVWAVEAGMTPLQAIEAATANGPETLGKIAPKSGQLKGGFDADFIAVTESPLEDVGVLTVRENIEGVWKGGRRYKG